MSEFAIVAVIHSISFHACGFVLVGLKANNNNNKHDDTHISILSCHEIIISDVAMVTDYRSRSAFFSSKYVRH